MWSFDAVILVNSKTSLTIWPNPYRWFGFHASSEISLMSTVQECCTRSRYQVKGKYITCHNNCAMWLFAYFWHNTPHLNYHIMSKWSWVDIATSCGTARFMTQIPYIPWIMHMNLTCFVLVSSYHISGMLCEKQVSRTGTSNYTPHILWDVITCLCPGYLLLSQHSSWNL